MYYSKYFVCISRLNVSFAVLFDTLTARLLDDIEAV
jgi:hypothetical protein